MSLLGKTLNDYQINALLGGQGIGVVCRAFYPARLLGLCSARRTQREHATMGKKSGNGMDLLPMEV